MKKLFIFHLLILSHFTQGQEWIWAQKADATIASQQVTKLEVDTLGNVYALGVNKGEAVYGKFKLREGTFLLKYSTEGQLQWAQNLGFPATYLQVSKDLNVYLACNYSANISTATNSFTSNGGDDILLTKLDSEGKELWSRSYGGLSKDGLQDMRTDKSGNIYLTGGYSGDTVVFHNYMSIDTANYGRFFIAKINSLGITEWVDRGIQDTSYYYYADGNLLAIDKFDRAYVIGTAGQYQGHIYGVRFTAKYNPDGKRFYNYWWAPYYYGYLVGDLQIDDSLNIYMTEAVDHFSGPPPLHKLDSLMNPKWGVGCGGQYGCYRFYTPKVAHNGVSFLMGQLTRNNGSGCSGVKDSVHIYDGPVLPINGDAEMVLLQINNRGTSNWYKTTGSTGIEVPTCAALDATGNYYLAGTYDKSVDFDGKKLWSDIAGPQVFVAKMGEKKSILPPAPISKIMECVLNIYPNPTNDFLLVSSECRMDRLDIYNSQGQIFHEATNVASQKIIDLSTYPQGCYLVHVKSNDQSIIKKVVVKE